MAYEDAARFLAKVVTWPDASVDPPEFFVNIHVPYSFTVTDEKTGLETVKQGWTGRACRTQQEALNYIKWQDGLNVDIYVCMSSQSHAGKLKYTSKTKRPYYTAVRGEIGALWHRSVYLDIDVKSAADDPDGKCYRTTQEAVRGFVRFLRDTGLPDPTVILASGSGGFHIHWVTDEPMTTAEWRVLTNLMLAAIWQHKFKCDVKVTSDAARILRVPGTRNH